MPGFLEAPTDLVPVQAAVARALVRVESVFESAIKSDLPPVDRLCRHVERYRGKMLRPALVLLCGLAAGGHRAEAGGDAEGSGFDALLGESHIAVAAVCEMIHMATLVHDDVLDDADTRRRGSTVNRLHGNEAAVVLGDYLFSAAFRLCSSLESQSSALLIGATGMSLCAGELLQLHHRQNFSLDEATYYEIVKRKTASLIATACRLGAAHAGASSAMQARFERFGLEIGIAFQIQDDLLDLTGEQAVVGKPLRRDLALGKLTLPLIHHLAVADPARRAATLRLLEEQARDEEAGMASDLAQALRGTGSLEHARSAAAERIESAKREIAVGGGVGGAGGGGGPGDSPAGRLLALMADAVLAREH